jgi:guanylate kinase
LSAKTDKYTIKNCHSQNVIASLKRMEKKGKSPSKSPIHKLIKIKLITIMNNNDIDSVIINDSVMNAITKKSRQNEI